MVNVLSPVDTVEDGETDLSPVRLRSGAAGERPGVLSPGDTLRLPVLRRKSMIKHSQ